MKVSVSEKETRASGGEAEERLCCWSSSSCSEISSREGEGSRPQVEESAGRDFIAVTIERRIDCWVDWSREPVSGSGEA